MVGTIGQSETVFSRTLACDSYGTQLPQHCTTELSELSTGNTLIPAYFEQTTAKERKHSTAICQCVAYAMNSRSEGERIPWKAQFKTSLDNSGQA
jgi:hypothetical protein